MTPNVGPVDRVLRVALGAALLAWFALGSGGLHWMGLIGIVPLATAFLRWCPAYGIFGINTCPHAKG